MAQPPRPAGRHARTLSTPSHSARRPSDGPPLGILLLVGALVIGLIAVVAIRAQREESTGIASTSELCDDAIGVSAPAELTPLVDSYAATGDGCLAATVVASGPADVRILSGAEARIRIPQPEATALGATGVSSLVGALVGSSTVSLEDLPAAIGTGSLGRLARALQPVPPEDPLFPEVADRDSFAASTSAVLTTAAGLRAYQSSAAAMPLVGVVIGEGAASVPLRVRGDAAGLVEHLLSEEGQTLIRAAGYYGADGQPPTEQDPVTADLVGAEAVILDDRQLAAAPSLLDTAVRPRDVVVLVDASAALRDPLEGETSRQLAVAAAAERVVPAGADVRLSLWLGGTDGPQQAIPPEATTAETLTAVRAQIAGSRPAGAPDLATSVRETLGNSLVYARDPDRELVLLVIVPAGRALTEEEEAGLLTYLRSAVRPDQSVRLSVVSVGGPSPDLDGIAAAGRGVATSAASVAELPGALTTAVVGR